MKRSLLAVALATAACTALVACQRPAPEASAPAPAPAEPAATAETTTAPAAKTVPTDLDQLAQRVVTQSAAVKEGEIVLINGQAHDAELLEDLAVNVRKVGGFPLVTYDSDRLSKRMFFDVPEKYDSQADALGAKLAGLANVVISVGNGMNENLFEGADPKRLAALGKVAEPVGQAFMKHNVRTVEIGNNLYPTPWRAER